MERFLTPLIYGLVLILLPLMAMNSLITNRYLAGLYEALPPVDERIAAEERLGLALVAIYFLDGGQPADEAVKLLAAQRWPGERTALYTGEELNHMVDVKNRVVQARTLLWFAGLGLVAIWLWCRRDKIRVRHFCCSVQNAAAFVMMITLGTTLIVILFFPLANVYFHALLFGGLEGNWQFPDDSGLITLFPLHFWFAVALSWVGRTLLLALAGILVAGGCRYKMQHIIEPDVPVAVSDLRDIQVIA